MKSRQLLGALLCSVVGLLSGCQTYGVERESNLDLLQRSDFPVLVMTPPQLFMAHRPYQVYEYSHDLVENLSRESNIPVIAPWEYDADGSLSNQGRRSALSAIIDGTAVTLTNTALLDFRIDEHMTDRATVLPSHMGEGVELHYEIDVVITLVIRAFPLEEEVATVVVEFEDQVFGPGSTPTNPRPILREGIRTAAREMAILMHRAWPDSPEGFPPQLDAILNPRQMFTYQLGAGDPLEGDFEGADEFDRAVARLTHYRYFDDEMSSETMAFFEEAPPGLLIEQIDPSSRDLGLEVGDYITGVEGIPVTGYQSFSLPFLTGTVNEGLDVTFLRGNETFTIEVPVQPPSD